jgi:tRNA (guanine-N7-)-methyltransferase
MSSETNPPRPGKIEREFGVPIPGEIVEPERWTKTALKKVPPGIIDFENLFGRKAPLVIDLGCGNGRSTIGSAVILPLVIRYATRRANQRGLANVRFAVIGGRELLAEHIAPGTIAEILCYHPQPYHDPGEVHRRLITPEFLLLAHRALVPGGLFVIQTDDRGYWNEIQRLMPLYFDFTEHPGRWPDAPRGRTRREIMALSKRLNVYRGIGRSKPLNASFSC